MTPCTADMQVVAASGMCASQSMRYIFARSIWWLPPFHQDVKIHTILDLRPAPMGGSVIAFQV